MQKEVKMFFASKLSPGSWMNRYGVVFLTARGGSFLDVTPEQRRAIEQEAFDAGYHRELLSAGDQIWRKPEVA